MFKWLKKTAVVAKGEPESDVSAIQRGEPVTQLAISESVAFLNQGNAHLNNGNLEEAAECYRLAIKRNPHFAEACTNLGRVYQVQGNLDEAIALYRKAIVFNPNLLPAQQNLGLALMSLGQNDAAEESFRRVIALTPENSGALQNLGAIAAQRGDFPQAETLLRRALELKPDYVEAHYNLGLLLMKTRRMAEAETSYRRALELKPDYTEAHNNLGLALHDLGRMDEAEASYRRALQIKPNSAEPHSNLGNLLKEIGRLDEAEAGYRRALQIKPDYADAQLNLGITLQDLGRLDEAEASFRRALEIKPDYAEAHFSLGNTLKYLNWLDEAEASYRRALEIKPEYVEARNNMLFTLNYHPDMSAEDIYRAYQEYDTSFGIPLRPTWRVHSNDKNADRRLRLGYVSPDFCNHACRSFLEPLLAHHDKTQIEVYTYAELSKEDDWTIRYKSYADHWVPTKGMSDEALAERIRSDGIDILVELAGHTAGNRLPVFARKPAPVSVSWLGYGYTTGLSAIDYYLTDEACVPTGCEGLFAEQPWRIATPAFIYRPIVGMGAVNCLPAQERGYITFGTLTRSVRVNHRTIRVWAKILKAVPNSRLVIDSSNFKDPAMQERMAARFAEHGIARERLEIGFHSPPWDVLRGIDIGLDCFPHNSGTTLFETLYMGVPYITLAGRPSVGRLGSSILQGVGHPEWIAESEDDYVAKAVELASDVVRLSEIRATLREQMEASPLRDEAGFAHKVEEAYRGMWKSWCGTGDRGMNQGANKPTIRRTMFNWPKTTAVASKAEPALDVVATTGNESISQLAMIESEALKNRGNVHFDSGKLDEAAECYRRAIERNPRYAEAYTNLGRVFQTQGNLDEAAALYRKAIEFKPNLLQAHQNLGIALISLGQADAAEQSLRRLIALGSEHSGALQSPGVIAAHNNLGTLLMNAKRLPEAEAAYRRALELKPDYAEVYNNLGTLLMNAKRLPEAEAAYRRALELKPDYAEVYNNLGILLKEAKRLPEAEVCYRRALELNPGYAEAYYNLGTLLMEAKHLPEAEASYHRALELKPDYAEAHNGLGILVNLRNLGQLDSAVASYRRALEIKPDFADAYSNLGSALMEQGKMGEAEKFLNKAIELAPGKAMPLTTALLYIPYQLDDPRFDQLETVYARRESLTLEERIRLNFSMGKAMENIGQYDRSFSAYEEGNRLHYQAHPFYETKDEHFLEKSYSFFTADLFKKFAALADTLPAIQDERVPIFIVGMPRSGTTLIEQILASHPALFGAGELTTLGDIAAKTESIFRESINAEAALLALRKLGQEYIDHVWKLAPKAFFITDKMPANYQYLGLIHLMMPNAKIIHSMRDPMDTCFSCYTQLFTFEHEYSYDLKMLGRQYLRYKKLMEHWHNVLPSGRILDVRYEDNIADPEREARRLLEYLGLPWDPACLRFYETKRAVSTASVVQVRKPLYSSSVARWKRFERYLVPLLEIIHPTKPRGSTTTDN